MSNASTLPAWQQIRDTLLEEIANGQYPPGSKLPTEAALAARFAVNRHTVRRALGDLQEAGLVVSKRGAGVFVTDIKPVPYAIGEHTRFTQNLESTGREGRRDFVRLETVKASQSQAKMLGIKKGALIHCTAAVGYADAVPILYGEAIRPAAPIPDFLDHLSAVGSITKALTLSGVASYRRERTRLTADNASAAVARHLGLRPSAPVLKAVGTNVTPEGKIIEYGTTWFAGERVELVVE